MDIDSKLAEFAAKRTERHGADVVRYRTLIAKVTTLSEAEGDELQTLADRLNISSETVRQHAAAWQRAAQYQARLDREPTLAAEMATAQAELAKIKAEFTPIREAYEKQAGALLNEIDRCERSILGLSTEAQRLRDLKWRNRELWMDDPEIAATVAAMERRERERQQN